MIYKIFHNPKPDFQEVSLWEDIFDHEIAGVVEAPSLDYAYTASQNGEEPWSPFNNSRSTAVGDVIQDELGDMYSVANEGFILIRPDVLPE